MAAGAAAGAAGMAAAAVGIASGTAGATASSPRQIHAPPLQPAMSDEAWWELEEEDRMRWCMQQLELLKDHLGGDGRLKRDSDSEKVMLQTKVFGRDVKLQVDWDTGWSQIEMPCRNRLGTTIRLRYEEGKSTRPSFDADDEWEEESDEVVHIFAPGVYIEDDEDDVEEMLAAMAKIPADVQQAMFMSLQRKVVGDWSIYSSEIDCDLDVEFYALADPTATLERAFKVMAAVSVAIERAR